MSIFASILRSVYKLSGAKKAFALPEDALRKEIEKQNRHRGVFTPTDSKAYYETIAANGFPCLIVREHPKPSERAILYFFGGGMVIGPDKGDLPVMRKLCRETGCDVWFPFYPLCMEHCITETYAMVYDLNRITQNRAKGRNTFIFIDEIYLLFQHEYSANFLFTLWKRVRKYGAYCTGITQNVDDLLQSHTARTMLANSEFIIMLNQSSTDKFELAKLLNISDLQMSYITNVGAGQGLLKVGSSLVPFVNKFPRNTELYKLMTTKFGEV